MSSPFLEVGGRVEGTLWEMGEAVESKLHMWEILDFPMALGKWKSKLFIAIFRYFVLILQPSMQHPTHIRGRTQKQLWTTSLVDHSVTSIWWDSVLCYSGGLLRILVEVVKPAVMLSGFIFTLAIWQAVFLSLFLSELCPAQCSLLILYYSLFICVISSATFHGS